MRCRDIAHRAVAAGGSAIGRLRGRVARWAFWWFATVATVAAAQPASPAMAEMERMRVALDDGSAIVFDIREAAEHATGVAAGVRPVPMSELKQRLDLIPRDRPVLLVCNTQNRSAAMVAALRERGWTQVQFVQGGMAEWVRRGWATVPPGATAAASPAPAPASGR